jgi:hypothetical protein
VNGLMKSDPLHDGAFPESRPILPCAARTASELGVLVMGESENAGGARGRHPWQGNIAQRTGLTISRNMGSVRQNSVRISLRDPPLSSRHDRSLSWRRLRSDRRCGARRLSPVNGPRSTSTATVPGVIVIENANADYGVTVNLLALVAVPPEVVTAMVPVIAPVGTRASTSVSLITW